MPCENEGRDQGDAEEAKEIEEKPEADAPHSPQKGSIVPTLDFRLPTCRTTKRYISAA